MDCMVIIALNMVDLLEKKGFYVDENRLEKILNNVDGIESAKVSLEEKSADIKYNEEEVELNTILQEIEDAGFKGE